MLQTCCPRCARGWAHVLPKPAGTERERGFTTLVPGRFRGNGRRRGCAFKACKGEVVSAKVQRGTIRAPPRGAPRIKPAPLSCAAALLRFVGRRHDPQHFFSYQRLARDGVAGVRNNFQTHAQSKVQGDWLAQRNDAAYARSHHTYQDAQSAGHRTRHAALKQFHRYFVPHEVLQRVKRVARCDPPRRHDSCLSPG